MSRPRDTQRSKLYAAEREAWKMRTFDHLGFGCSSWDRELLLEPVTEARKAEWIAHWASVEDHHRQYDPTWPTAEEAWVKTRLDLEAAHEFVDDFLHRIQASRWWEAQGYGYVDRDLDYKGYNWSRGSRREQTIRIARTHFNRWVVLHEVAHCLQPLDSAGHGPEFCAIYLKLVARWIGPEEARSLRAAMVKHKVRHRSTLRTLDKPRRGQVRSAA